jgi:diadenosine tetraphosphate (Ap4A) HIT family hydrolase
MSDSCLVCERVALWKASQNPYVIAEFEHSIFVVGDHQFHRGYCLLLWKEHIRELHDLSELDQQAMLRELMRADAAVTKTFQPWKMNFACYGYAEPHVHWHLFPRYDTDPDRARNPLLHCDQFKEHKISPDEARSMAVEMRKNLT